jgi:FkbM family methyltransferase
VRVGKWRLNSTLNHPLTKSQATHPFYDKFLPILCSQLAGTAIDIGANIGDSTAAILDSNSEMRILAVEPDDAFFSILKMNCDQIDVSRRVTLVKAFIAKCDQHFKVLKNSSGSTGHIEQVSAKEAAAPTLTYAQLLKNVIFQDISIVKSDTDGFDSDVLTSMADYIEQTPDHLPIIFFEMQTYLEERGFGDSDRPSRQQSYLDAISRLFQLGYNEFILFDNFGVPVVRHRDIQIINQLEEYLSVSQLSGKRIPANFFDVVLFCDRDCNAIEQAISLLKGPSGQ